jgi:lysozyme family protein
MADYKNTINFTLQWEGGLSNAKTDGASANPSPCPHNGVTGWHTNKGVTWSTFSTMAVPLGYEASCSNFISMPDDIWLKIYKHGFWDKFLLDNYSSQAIADVISQMYYNAGFGGAYRQLAKFLNANYGMQLPINKADYNTANAKIILDKFNAIVVGKEKEVHDKLIEHFRQFYISLNNPTYQQGWLNRLEALNQFTLKSIK